MPLSRTLDLRTVSLLLTGVVLALAGESMVEQAQAAQPARWTARIFPGPPGTDTRFLTIANDGSAAGVRVFPDASTHAVYFNRRSVADLSARLGPISSIAAMNDRGQMVGYLSSNPAARVGNLFVPGRDPSLMPQAFFLSGRRLVKLPLPSTAAGINQGGEVVGTFRVPDGSPHAFLWRPALTGRTRLRKFVDLGPGSARAISDALPRRRTVRNARTPLATGAGAFTTSFTEAIVGSHFWQSGQLTNRVVKTALPSGVLLSGVNTHTAVGGLDSRSGQQAVTLDLLTRLLRPLPNAPGFPQSNATSTSSSGAIAGSVANGPVRHGAVWLNGRVNDVNSLPGVSLPPGTEVSTAQDVTVNGLVAGAATTPSGDEAAVVVAPSPLQKRPLLLAALDRYFEAHGTGPGGTTGLKDRQGHYHTERVSPGNVSRHVKASVDKWYRNQVRTACQDLSYAEQLLKSITGLNAQEYYDALYEKGYSIVQIYGFSSYQAAQGRELYKALEELRREIPCPDGG